MSPERPQPGSGAADAAAAPDPDLVDAGTDATPDCPVVADQCPPECAAVESSPLHPVALCFMPSEILGCADPNPGSTTDDNCLRRSDGALFPGISGAFAGPLVASGEFAPCTTEENDRVSQAIGTCESSPENPEPVQPGVVQCSIVADACPAECAVIESAPLLAGESCYSPVTTLGCFDASVASTADGNCLRRSDGALFVDISGTFADPMIASGEFALCTDADFERATQAVGVSCESPSNPEPSPDAGTVPPDVKYSAQITNGIDCCDFYTVVKADPVLDLCLFAEVREELGSAPVLSSASALESANDCWNRLQEPRTEASTITGDVSFSFDATPATATFQLTADFTNPPSWLPERVTASFESLPLDGEWYPRQ
jgi:hypothetical protein